MSREQNSVVALVGRARSIPPPCGDDWARAGRRMRAIAAARPTPAHERLRELRDAGRLSAVIADSDDILLDEVGIAPDVELRGSVRQSICPVCGYTEPLMCLLEMLPEPRCAACGNLLSPGTPPEPDAFQKAEHLVRRAGVLLLLDVSSDHPLARLAPRTERLGVG